MLPTGPERERTGEMEEAVSETARVQIQARSDGGASSTGWSSCSWSGGAPRSHQGPQMGGARHREGRSLLIFREMQGNVSLWCSTSGPCLPHEYSEKFHPSTRRLKWRKLFDTSSESQDKQVSYRACKSCLPEKVEE